MSQTIRTMAANKSFKVLPLDFKTVEALWEYMNVNEIYFKDFCEFSTESHVHEFLSYFDYLAVVQQHSGLYVFYKTIPEKEEDIGDCPGSMTDLNPFEGYVSVFDMNKEIIDVIDTIEEETIEEWLIAN